MNRALGSDRDKAKQDARQLRWTKIRLFALAILLFSAYVVVAVRAWNLQVEQSERLGRLAEQQHLKQTKLSVNRAAILDRNGETLAVSVEADSVWANPRQLRARGQNPVDVATRLALILPNLDVEMMIRRLRSDKLFVWVERHVTPKRAVAVRDAKIPGIYISKEAKRYYPGRQLAAHLLGFSNVDGEGIEGVELQYNEFLRGSQQTMEVVKDGRGATVFSSTHGAASKQHALVLTIDKSIQYVAERELELAVRTFEAKAGSVVVADPKTGDLLAVANYPTFNPNNPGKYSAFDRRNRAFTDRFEPGSTLKMFTIAGALDSGTVGNNTHINCGEGELAIGDFVVHDSKAWGRLSLTEILAYSSNVGIAKIGQRLGRKNMFRYLRRFGFGAATPVDFPGEAAGILRHHSQWYELDTATVPFGQGMSVTAVQLAVASSAIANGGVLPRARLVSSPRQPAERPRRILHSWAAESTSRMLVHVTQGEGTGIEAAIDGFAVAGKTGTAQKADYVSGGYAKDKWVASFVGFVPANRPRLVIAVVIDEPMVKHQGGVVATPVFRRVASAAMRHLGVPPAGHARSVRKTMRRQPKHSMRHRVQVSARARQKQGLVPDFRGLNVREAMQLAALSGVSLRIQGSGFVQNQSLQPGSKLKPSMKLSLELRPNETMTESVKGEQEHVASVL